MENTKSKRTNKVNRTKLNLFLDIALTLIFVVEMEYHFTGIALHELMGLIFGVALIIHLILHWNWIVSITRTFFKKVWHESRLNYVLNLALFAAMFIATITGIMISKTLGLDLGLDMSLRMTTQYIHILASESTLLIIGLHVAMHWKWIASNVKKYLLSFNFGHRKHTMQPVQEVS